jgi:DNA-binding SARP family transcriptional activator/TolB-like protein
VARTSLRLLGGFEVSADKGPPIEFPTKRARAILAYLAVCPGHECSREKLATLLWEDSGEKHARGSLRQALSYLRKSLGGSTDGCLLTDGDTIALDGDAFDIDVEEFERSVAGGTPEALAEASSLYRGEFLAGFDLGGEAFESWLRTERMRLRELAVSGWSRLLEWHIAAGDLEPAIQAAMRLLSEDPLREDIQRKLMELYLRQGRLGSAINQYEACREILKRELDADPEPETEQLHREIRRPRGGTGFSIQGAAITMRRKAIPAKRLAAGMLAAVVLLSALAIAGLLIGRNEPPVVTAIGNIPEGPSIAVLPFDDFSAEPRSFFAPGFNEDLVTELARNRKLFVIARNSTVHYIGLLKGRAPDISEAGAALGARYLVEGSVERGAGRIRINAQLIEAETERHLWAGKYDREETIEGLYDIRRELSREIASEILPHIKAEEERRALAKPPESLEVYDLVVQGIHFKHTFTAEASLKAREVLKRAIELDPDYAEAYAYLGYTLHVDKALRLTGQTGPGTNDEAMELLRTAVRLKPDLAVAHQAMSNVLRDEGRIEDAVAAAERSVELGPNDAENWIFLAGALWSAGRIEESVEAADRAMRHNPFAPVYYLAIYGRTLYFAGRNDDARKLLSACAARYPGYLTCRLYLAATLIRLGERNAAVHEIDESLARWPNLTVEAFVGQAIADPDMRSRIAEDLARAGLPADGS